MKFKNKQQLPVMSLFTLDNEGLLLTEIQVVHETPFATHYSAEFNVANRVQHAGTE